MTSSTLESEPRYRVTHEGRRLIDAYGITGHRPASAGYDQSGGVDLSRTDLSQVRHGRLPVYSAFHVTDAEGRKVEYERLLLPFGDGGACTT